MIVCMLRCFAPYLLTITEKISENKNKKSTLSADKYFTQTGKNYVIFLL